MDSENQQIAVLVVTGFFFLSLPFLIQKKDFPQDVLVAQNTLIHSSAQIPKTAVAVSKRAPASVPSPYSVNDFKAKNLLNKKILTPKEYKDALEASKHVGISYKPHVNSENKVTESDVVATRKIEAEMRAFRESLNK